MTSTRAGACILAALLILLLLPTAAWADVAVSIQDDGVDPDPVVVDVGEPIRFTNDTDGDVRLIDDMQRWDSGDLEPGQTFVFTFNVDGVFTFTSEDGAITGTVEVGDVDAEPSGDEPSEGDEASGDEGADERASGDEDADDEDAADPPADPDADDEDADPPADPEALADTGLPSARIAWLAALITLVGIIILHRTEAR